MFNIGDEVIVRDGGARGEVVDMYDNIVYVELTNGVEQEHKASALVNAAQWEEEQRLVYAAKEAQRKRTESALDLPSILKDSYRPNKGDQRHAQNIFKELNKLYPGLVAYLNSKLKERGVDIGGTSVDHLMALANEINVPMTALIAASELGGSYLPQMLRMLMARVFLSDFDLLAEYACVRMFENARQTIAAWEAEHGK